MLETVTRGIGMLGFEVKRKSPEILLIAGLVTGVATVVVACKQTLKAGDILDEHKADMEKVHEAEQVAEEHPTEVEYTAKDKAKDTAIVYAKTAGRMTRLYAPAVGLGVVSGTCLIFSHVILKKRYLGVVAAYGTIAAAFKKYRERVIEAEGVDKDREYRYGVKREEVAYTYTDEEGQEAVGHEITTTADYDPSDPRPSGYSKIFDSCNPNYEKDAESNRFFLEMKQNHLTDLLRARGYLFLNEAYKELGFEPTKAGQIVGWIYNEKNPVGDNYVDLGITVIRNSRFVNGYEYAAIVDFNVDGPILDLIQLENL